MFRIEELLNLFKDETEVIKIITRAYEISQRENKELSDKVFEQFYFFKTIYPELSIKVNYELDNPSYCDVNTKTINLNGIFDETTFFHELTHLFSYQHSKFNVPKEYKTYKEEFNSIYENDSIIISFLNLCKTKKEKLLNREKELYEINEEINTNDNEYFIISKIEDIIDSLYSGKSHDYGLRSIKDNDSYVEKSEKSAGHGCEYFETTGYEFEEILANYQAIKLISPNNDLFLLLKQILGTSFIEFLEKRCKKINGEQVDNLDINNNISKK